jgi:L-iditol 2-dehydrogenase
LENRRRIAARFSDCQFDFNEQTIPLLMEFTHGRGADAILPCCPGNAPFLMGLNIAAKRGKLGFFSGLTDRTASITNSALNIIHYRELTVTGAYGCSSAHVREALDLLAAHKVSMEGVPSLDISWQELPVILSRLEPSEHIITFFNP